MRVSSIANSASLCGEVTCVLFSVHLTKQLFQSQEAWHKCQRQNRLFHLPVKPNQHQSNPQVRNQCSVDCIVSRWNENSLFSPDDEQYTLTSSTPFPVRGGFHAFKEQCIADEGTEAAAKGAKRPSLVHVDSGAIDTLTDGESSGSEDSFLPDDASAADISIHDPGARIQTHTSTCQQKSPQHSQEGDYAG